MAELLASDLELLTGKSFAHVVTLRADGSPHAVPTWVDAADGYVLVNTAVGRVKDRNVRRDPRVAVSIHAHDDPYLWLSIGGIVAERVTGPEAEQHIDALNRRYHDGEPWKYREGQVRVLYRIRPDRIVRGRA